MAGGTLVIRFIGDTREFSAATKGLSGQLAALGARVKQAIGLAVPIAIGAAVSSAKDFEKAFGRIAAISNASAKDIERWRGQVMDLAGETAKAPTELAEALFFLSSAGIDAGDVMDVLDKSARAAAVGLGSTVDVAKITANALNAYAGSGLTAAQVTDTLVAAVREGSAEPEEFAAALGRVLPIANQVGITFDQVTASLAAMSNIGLDVDEGVTALRGTLQALAAPTKQTQDALAALGLSADDVRESLAGQGLIATLRMLFEAADGNIDVMRELVPNVRALTGVFSLTGQQADKVDAIFRNVLDSSGSLSEAWGEMEKNEAFRIEKALNRIRVAATELAEDALPLLADALEDAIGFGGTFARGLLEIRSMLGFGPSLEEVAAKTRALVQDWKNGAITATELDRSLQDLSTTTFTNIDLTDELQAAIDAAVEAEGKWRASGDDLATSIREGVTPALEELRPTIEAVVDPIADVREEMGKLRKEVRESIESSIGSLGAFERKWDLTSAAAVRDMEGMANKMREFARDLKAIDREAIPEGLEAWLREQGPDAIHAFVSATAKQKKDWIRAWKEYEAALSDATDRMASQASSAGAEIGQAFSTGLAGGIRQFASQVAQEARAAVQAAVAAAEEAQRSASPSREMARVGRDFMLGYIEGIRDEMGSLVDAIREAVGEGMSKARLLAAKELEAFAGDVADRIGRLRDNIREFRSAIREGFGFNLIAGAMGLEEGQSIQDFLASQLDQARAFASGLQQLAGLGLDRGLLADLASQGPEALPFIQALLAGGEDLIAQFNETQAAITQITQDTINVLVDEVFGKQIKRAGELLDELAQRLEKFLRSFGGLDDDLDGVARGLQRLWRILERLGAVSIPHMAHGGVVTGPSLVLAGEAGPEAIVPLSQLGMGGMSEDRLADLIVRAMRRAGPMFAPVVMEDDIRSRVLGTVGAVGSRRARR